MSKDIIFLNNLIKDVYYLFLLKPFYVTCFLLLFGIQLTFPQSYVVKFKSSIADSIAVSSLFRREISKIQSLTSTAINFSVKPVATAQQQAQSKFPWRQYAILKFNALDEKQIVRLIAGNNAVEYIQPIYTYHVYSIPNDSAFLSQWNLSRIRINRLYENEILHSSLPSVIVGVVDTGIDDDHPDLVNVIAYNSGEMGLDNFSIDKRFNGKDDDNNGFIDDWKGYDFVDLPLEDIGDWSTRDNQPEDENGHGTSVSGIIGAQTNNEIGITGIAPCKILPLRAFGKNGSGIDIDIASAIVYAVDNGAEVINMSFGDVIQSPILYDAIRYAYENNVVLVASSGNDGGNNPHYPSDFSEVISTGSINQFNSRSIFSSRSPSLDIMAPGEQIITTTFIGGYTNNFSGTSAAAPHVSGVVALIKSIEHQKMLSNPNFVALSNEEIRGILLNSADDAGEKGWDSYYGAGIVNAEKALQAVSGSIVKIFSPALDEIIHSDTIAIILTASTPYIYSVQLYYGRGEDPVEWVSIAEIKNRILVNDTILFLANNLPDGTYTLRLIAKNSKGNDIEFQQRVFILKSAPTLLSLNYRDSVLVGNEYGTLIEARVDRICNGKLYYKRSEETEFSVLQSLGLQMNHAFLLSAKDFTPNTAYDIYCEFVENSPLKRTTKFFLTDSIETPIIISSHAVSSTGFIKKNFSLPAGFLLNSVQTVSNKPTVILNEYDADGNFGRLKAFEFNGNSFVVKDSTHRSWVPRDFHYIRNESPQVLVQDRGISQLFRVDTLNGKYFSSPMWGDSTDVWASNLADLDGDNKPEIIARNTAEYLIYKNNGNNTFSLTARLPNPTSPLPGEAKNQFGPPKALIGNFTNSGLKEIIFADYDGDVIMYRQPSATNLNFVLAGIDTSDLYEMSDFITAGDFNGDGIMDFAVAGHSNLNLNVDREYDVPVWTVKVFSHLPSNTAGTVTKIWEQHFVGVKAGIHYDNGLTSGKLSPSDTKDALFICFNPFLYIFEWNAALQTFVSKWIHSSQSNGIVIYDFDNDGLNDLGFHTNSKTEFWSLEAGAQSVRTPWNIYTKPLTPTKILLRWNSSVSNHNIYRGTHYDLLVIIASVSGTEWIDTTVQLNKQYFYAVSAVNNTESAKTVAVSVIPHSAPTITSLAQTSINQVSVEISFDVSATSLLGTQFQLNNAINSSSCVWQSSRKLLVTFPSPILAGNHYIRIKQLVDVSGMAGDTSQIYSFVSVYQPLQEFFVRSVALLSRNNIAVEFSEPPDLTTALNSLHYTVRTIAKRYTVQSVSFDSSKPAVVQLHFGANVNLSELTLRLEVHCSERIVSQMGTRLREGKGQVLSIAQETESIENIVVYPNPVKNSQTVSFVNIPANCQITVYSLAGEKLKVFNTLTTSEGISWNLRDEQGNPLASGIYLLRVEKLDNAGTVSQTHLGKFAVIK